MRGRPTLGCQRKAILVDNGNSTWLLWDGRRSQIDLADHAVTNALGLGLNNSDVPAPRPIALGLFNAIPEAPAADGTGHPERRRPGGLQRAGADRGGRGVLWPGPELVGRGALLRGVARRPAADLPGARGDPAQHQLLRSGPTAAAGCRRRGQAAGVADAGHRTLSRPAGHPRRRGQRSCHVRLLEQTRWRRHQLAEPAVRLGAAGARVDPHRRSGRRRVPRRPPPGSRWRRAPATSPRPSDRRRRRARHRIAVLGLRHRGALRHRQRGGELGGRARQNGCGPWSERSRRCRSRGRCCHCSPAARRCRAPTRCWRTTDWRRQQARPRGIGRGAPR